MQSGVDIIPDRVYNADMNTNAKFIKQKRKEIKSSADIG